MEEQTFVIEQCFYQFFVGPPWMDVNCSFLPDIRESEDWYICFICFIWWQVFSLWRINWLIYICLLLLLLLRTHRYVWFHANLLHIWVHGLHLFWLLPYAGHCRLSCSFAFCPACIWFNQVWVGYEPSSEQLQPRCSMES